MPKQAKLILSVTNDLESDRRVHKIAVALQEMGFEVYAVGRKRPWSKPLKKPFKTHRFKLLFSKKVWFYAEYNIRLFFYLLFNSFDVYVANDLDSLLPNFLVSKIKNKPLVYDSHELYTEVPELIQRPRIRQVWMKIEKWIFPKLKQVYTVNDEIAKIYSEKYQVDVNVIRNMSPKYQKKELDNDFIKRVKGNKKMLILQGAGINIDRGAEELIEAMQYVEQAVLYIIGSGDVFEKLKQMTSSLNLHHKVKIIDRIPYHQLLEYTQISDIGLSLDKGTNPNYENSLPNKIFDYIQCHTPLIVSNRKVVAEITNHYQVGTVIPEVSPQYIAEAINTLLNDTKLYNHYLSNTRKASEKLSWEHETQKLSEIYTPILKQIRF